MKIRKVSRGYYVGSKFYSKEDFNAIIFIWIVVIFVGLPALVFFGWKISENIKAKKIAISEDPVNNLILALVDEPDWEDARRQLDMIGDPLLVALAPACDGKAVGSIIYDPAKPGPHPFVFTLSDGKSHRETYTYLNEWGPTSRQPDEVQLVICAYESEIVIEVCTYYSGAPINRVQDRLFLLIKEAATGKTIEQKIFTGSEPGKCPSAVTVAGHKTLKGSAVDYSEVNDYLQSLYD